MVCSTTHACLEHQLTATRPVLHEDSAFYDEVFKKNHLCAGLSGRFGLSCHGSLQLHRQADVFSEVFSSVTQDDQPCSLAVSLFFF